MPGMFILCFIEYFERLIDAADTNSVITRTEMSFFCPMYEGNMNVSADINQRHTKLNLIEKQSSTPPSCEWQNSTKIASDESQLPQGTRLLSQVAEHSFIAGFLLRLMFIDKRKRANRYRY